jgi:hypothetical protein
VRVKVRVRAVEGFMARRDTRKLEGSCRGARKIHLYQGVGKWFG